MTRSQLFVSYSHDDAELLGHDITMLEREYEISYDRGIQPGTDWRGHIANELMSCDGVLYYSSVSANRSQHCLADVRFALDLDKPILVIQLDDHELPPGLRMQELLFAEMLLGNGAETAAVVSLLKESLGRIDSWMGRFLLASAYQQSGQSMDAIIEWQKC